MTIKNNSTDVESQNIKYIVDNYIIAGQAYLSIDGTAQAANKIKQIEFQENKKYCDENDAAFYFSVVFNTKTERDKWLKEHNIVLIEDFFVKVEDFNI